MIGFRINITILFYFILLCEGMAQELSNRYPSDQQKFLLEKVDSYLLEESEYLLSEINDVSISKDGSLLLSMNSSPYVLKYTAQGREARKMGNQGRGPFEYLKPSLIDLHESSGDLFIWDSGLLKLIQLNNEGKGIKEYTGFKWAWGNFIISDSLIYIYNKGRSSGAYIQIYDPETYSYLQEIGQIDQEHAFYKISDDSGGICLKGEYIYFMSPSSLELHRFNISDHSIFSRRIQDPEFTVAPIENASAILKQGNKTVIELMRDASIIMDLFALDDYLVVMAQVGKATYNSEAGFFTAENKKIKFYVLDYSTLSLLDTFTFSLAINQKVQNRHWTTDRNNLIYISPFTVGNTNLVSTQPANDRYVVNYFKIRKN